MTPERAGLEVGDIVPNFQLSSTAGGIAKLSDFVGRSLVIFFYLQDDAARCAEEACAFRDLNDQFTQCGANIVGIGVDSIESHHAFAQKYNLPFSLLSDPASQAFSAYGVHEASHEAGETAVRIGRKTFLVSPAGRIVKMYERIDPATHAAEVLNDLRSTLWAQKASHLTAQAPVLLIPDVFPEDLCNQLIAAWEEENDDSGFMKEVEGKTVAMMDYSHKIRRDHFMRQGPVQDSIKRYVGTRVLPEIWKAFNYEVTRREDFRIACYDARRGGYFRPHRDNTTGGTAHRRFALSLLLNEEYDGGCLRFPEYGPNLYRPPRGSALIFSCSLLHEATDVTAGRRFVMLSFFYGEAEARRRDEYNRRSGGTYRA